MTLLFEKTLEQSTPFKTSLLCEEEQIEEAEDNDDVNDFVFEALTAFAQAVDDEVLEKSSEYNLEGTLDDFCSWQEFDEDTIDLLKGCLVAVSKEAFGEGTDEDIRSTLRILRTTPATTYTTPNKSGLQPLPGETGARAFFKQLRVAKHADSYGNDDVFQAKDVKVFDRAKFRYGNPYADFNNQKSTQTALKSPTLNVTMKEAFCAVDSVGMNIKTQWRVLNKLTGNYITKQFDRTQAEELASDLNAEYRRVLLGEIETPSSSLQEGYTLPSLPIQESLKQPLNPRYLQAIEFWFVQDHGRQPAPIKSSEHRRIRFQSRTIVD